MAHAILTITPAPAIGPGGRKLVIDCPHGTTTGHLLPGLPSVSQTDVLQLLLIRHDAAERCRCTRKLWRRVRQADRSPIRPRHGKAHRGNVA